MSHESRSVRVNVKVVKRDDWFVATCGQLPGLYLVHQDKDAVLEDVPEAVKVLIKAQHGLDAQVLPVSQSFDVAEGRKASTRRLWFPWTAILGNNLPISAHS